MQFSSVPKLITPYLFLIVYPFCLFNTVSAWLVPSFITLAGDWRAYLIGYKADTLHTSVYIVNSFHTASPFLGFVFWTVLFSGIYLFVAIQMRIFQSNNNAFLGMILSFAFLLYAFVWLSVPQTELFRSVYLLMTFVALVKYLSSRRLLYFWVYLACIPLLLFSHKFGAVYVLATFIPIFYGFASGILKLRLSSSLFLLSAIGFTLLILLSSDIYEKIQVRLELASYILDGGSRFASSSFYIGGNLRERLIAFLVVFVISLVLVLFCSASLWSRLVISRKSFNIININSDDIVYFVALFFVFVVVAFSSFNLAQIFRHFMTLFPAYLWVANSNLSVHEKC